MSAGENNMACHQWRWRLAYPAYESNGGCGVIIGGWRNVAWHPICGG